MKKLFVAALCCASSAVPAMAQTGHVHGSDCNHQTVSNEGTLDVTALSDGNSFLVANSSGGGLKFILNNLGGVEAGTDAFKGFTAAAAVFQRFLKDDITIRLDVQFSQLGPNILGSTGSTTNTVSYAGVKTLLAADAKTVFDQLAVSNLQSGATVKFVTNEPPVSGAINANTRFLDNNNTFDNLNIQVNTAQVKALGLNPTYLASNTTQRDGIVSFSNQFNWDFDRSDGVDPTKIDFVGVAAHEIGHALGFRSGVDLADNNALPSGGAVAGTNGARGLGNLAWGTVHDLFRYGEFAGNTELDWSIGGTRCYSLNAGDRCLALMSTGRFNGDLRQASHWKDDQLTGNTIGLLDPTATGPGGTRPFQAFTKFDMVAFDAMGYDLSVPEPSTWAMMIGGFGFVGAAMRRRRSVQVSFA